MVQRSELDAYVKWEALEKALKGLRDQIDSINFKVEEHDNLKEDVKNNLNEDTRNNLHEDIRNKLSNDKVDEKRTVKEIKEKEMQNERTQTVSSMKMISV
jgi:hypothetical protein